MTDENDDGIDGGLRKKQPEVTVPQQQQQENNLDQKGQSRSTDNSGASTPRRSKRSRPRVPNPNTGPQAGEKIQVISEDDEKQVVIVDNGGIVRKIRTIWKNRDSGNTLQLPTNIGSRPSPLRNAYGSDDSTPGTPQPQTAELRLNVPSPK
ncbi:hypothetical protein ABW19_dt0204424 [Dactylella cylindrospora]|nr:hypothetical protein ABW19_dt0204424 [Dactylella cylindrospora]